MLLLSAYAAQSHVYWQARLRSMFPNWQWTVLTLPPRHFSWRVRGNPLYWSVAERDTLEGDYDVLLATSMVDVACLRGLVPRLALLPTVLYFHENQFDYPSGSQQVSLLEAQMVSLYSALAADQLVFNSQHNRDSFLRGCSRLLKRLPDKVPAGIVAALEDKSTVLPVPVLQIGRQTDARWPGTPGDYPRRPLRVLWVGRFEYDKGPELLQKILLELKARELAFELAVVGQQFRQSPAVFAEIQQQFREYIVQFGYIAQTTVFREVLSAADVVLSTALHEFQGVAVLEAIDAGCIPVVPNRLVYPEILPLSYCYPCPGVAGGEEAEQAADLIESSALALARGRAEVPDIAAFSQAALRPRYQRVLQAVAGNFG